jgi:hypothetical protein
MGITEWELPQGSRTNTYFERSRDENGTYWTMRPTRYSRTSELEMWTELNPSETYHLRQDNRGQVDLISLDFGQACDLVRALKEALGHDG